MSNIIKYDGGGDDCNRPRRGGEKEQKWKGRERCVVKQYRYNDTLFAVASSHA